MKRIVFIIVLVFAMVMTAWADQFFAPLPSKVKITPPSPDIPQEIAGFSGTWYGFWDDGVAAALVVTKIEPAKDGAYKASVIYSWGPSIKGGGGGFDNKKAIVEPGKLTINFSGGRIASYRLLPDGVIEVEFRVIEKGVVTRIWYATLHRSQPDTPSLSSLFDDPPLPVYEEKRIIPPSSTLPPEIAGLSGIWHGVWSNGRAVALAVERIEPPITIAVYSYGKLQEEKGDWDRHEWKIDGNKLVYSESGGRTITFVLKSNGELEGTWSKKGTLNSPGGGETLHATLQKR